MERKGDTAFTPMQMEVGCFSSSMVLGSSWFILTFFFFDRVHLIELVFS